MAAEQNPQSEQSEQEQRVVELLDDSSIAMLTYLDGDKLVSKPMSTQDADFDGTLRFIAERDSHKVHALEVDGRVNVSFSNNGSWISVSGRATVANDEAKLRELWDTFTSSWLEGGPENPNNILIEVEPSSAEYWAAPGGSTIISLTNLVKSKVTGKRIEGDNERVDLG